MKAIQLLALMDELHGLYRYDLFVCLFVWLFVCFGDDVSLLMSSLSSLFS